MSQAPLSSSGTYPIVGIPVKPGDPIPARHEISAWYSNEENTLQVSLFILALAKFQTLPVDNQLSYFRVAGIHGWPQVSWDGVGGGFFCRHNMVTFPTWHRPYILLYEQCLYKTMLDIIRDEVSSDQQAAWKLAATQWRLPYWDWAAPQPYIKNFGLPEICTLDKVPIVRPDSNMRKVLVDNPLWKFSNPSGKPMGDKSMGQYAIPPDDNLPWDRCVATSRYGVVSKAKDPGEKWIYGVENWKDANTALQIHDWYVGNPGTLAEAVYRLLTPGYFTSWESFASTRWHKNNATDYMSLEYVHNNIHNWTGGIDLNTTGVGQMCDPPVAAFDPIFWLHHCNVDRQIAIFQTLNPKLWFDQPQPSDPAPTSDLEPFHVDDHNTTYTSNSVKDWTKLNYTYDTLASLTAKAHQGVAQPDVQHHLPGLRRSVVQRYGNTRRALAKAPGIEGRKNDYIINVTYDRYALDGLSYTLHFFLGEPPSGEVGVFSRARNHIGSVYTFSSRVELNADTPQCRNCLEQKKQGILSKAQVPITSILLSNAQNPDVPALNSLEPEEVESYLEQHLTWRAVSLTGALIDVARLPATKISVMKGLAEHPEDDSELSRFHSYTPMWRPTRGKVGGAAPETGA